MYENIRTQVILEDFSGNLRHYSFTDKEWKILGIFYMNRDISIRDAWNRSRFQIGETTISRAIFKFMKVGWMQETTERNKILNIQRGGRFMCGKTNRKKIYDLTPKGEKAYEEFSKKDKIGKQKIL